MYYVPVLEISKYIIFTCLEYISLSSFEVKIHETAFFKVFLKWKFMKIWCRFDADLTQIWCRFDADFKSASNVHHHDADCTQIRCRFEICIKSASNLHQICIKSASNLHQTCIKFASTFHQIYINSVLKKKKMFPRHVKMMCLETSSAETSSSPCLQILRSTCGFLKCTNSTCTSSTCTSPEVRQASWVPLTTHMYMQVSSTYLSSQSTQAQIKLHVYTIDNSQVHPSLKYMPV